MEMRTHITAYAAGMSGTATTPKTDVQATMTSTVNAEPAASATAAASPAATGATPAQPAAAPAQSPAAPAPNVAASATAAPSPVDAEAARRHLTAAQATLSQLTKLPAAAQLTGESRAQITQLVSNFNELGTAQSNWRASYSKVAANLTALLGPDTSDNEATAAVPTTATGTTATPGTAGTATVELDPTIRAKLVELRRNLVEFQKASGGLEK